ncbi:unnamed protein product [Acanthoscelides obtectus]|uniref:E3 ubiquitin-protein ligase Topors n=1 Tax=Acanthoscelides obtectus TaxID=200917 RepID=A0A9P0PP76_ACAOB|nr:unnamed protein product [Acanthoscelides obtectus]CAK1658771.1 E3 ubiquitin-protein ligase Topors [Acanthoscelides obtectus]
MMATRSTSSSPPPNCAICLGSFSNKCFSDSCMHQFCFKCLLEWSKIKAECPLCKQPFKRIIHNVKSNEEYDEHVVEISRPEIGPDEIHIIDTEDLLYLPQPSTRHHFHFRTTFTVDTRGEHAIQQMLLHHPLTSGGQISVEGFIPSRNLYQRRRRDNTSTSFRRSIYHRNLWVSAPPDVTGRYRDISPAYFRDCPGARTRLVPWLNRELNALLYEDTRLVMHLVDVILDHLPRHHICSRTFRNLLVNYLEGKTDHFIHEFYNFMRSPFDMVGYDRHVVYTDAPRSPPPYVLLPDEDVSDDSDVIIVGSSDPTDPVVIDLVNTDSDEPILVTQDEPMPVPVQEPVPIVDVTSTPDVEDVVVTGATQNATPVAAEPSRTHEDRPPLLPLKLRLKRKRQSGEKEQMEERRKRRRFLRRKRPSTDRSDSLSSTSSSSDFSSSSESSDGLVKYMRKRKFRKLIKKKRYRSSSEREVNVTNSSSSESSDDDRPLSSRSSKKALLSRKRTSSKKKGKYTSSRSTQASNQESTSWRYPIHEGRSYTPTEQECERRYTPPPRIPETTSETLHCPADTPSCSSYRMPTCSTIKSEESTDEDYPLTQLLNRDRKQVCHRNALTDNYLCSGAGGC